MGARSKISILFGPGEEAGDAAVEIPAKAIIGTSYPLSL
jgi:hypothetical protein